MPHRHMYVYAQIRICARVFDQLSPRPAVGPALGSICKGSACVRTRLHTHALEGSPTWPGSLVSKHRYLEAGVVAVDLPYFVQNDTARILSCAPAETPTGPRERGSFPGRSRPSSEF